ncbi:MAG: formylglycine-generating enzyme family protein [Bacteroidetes bacterium]|nr:MAG: formylglycine-generating enzyme family protein [Bacteroidota bacterium]
MVQIEEGSFEMGSNEYDDEKPIHTVNLNAFALCRYPVTQQLWREVMGADPEELYFTGADRAVEDVSWDDCQMFIQTLNARTGLRYRLPTEAEWEYAARGGKYGQGFEYSGSDDLDEVGWYSENSYSETQPTGFRAPNALGIYDLSGNVWEWCQDRYGYYQADPSNPTYGASRVLRGCSWYNDPLIYTRVSGRNGWPPSFQRNVLGFRLAQSI